MSSNIAVISLAFHHSVVVQLVLLCLLALSLASWTVILQKWAALNAARRELRELQPRLRADTGLDVVLPHGGKSGGTFRRALSAGFDRLHQVRRGSPPEDRGAVQDLREACESGVWREIRRLDSNLSFLATVGSLSPYIGLFGTVWGIIGAMGALGDVHEMSLASVAPGIAEALVATAAGLFAAIPALFAHNRFASDIDGLADDYFAVIEELGLQLRAGTGNA
ncbi:MAG TPA: MotA/TolQ/ExbB proton channel family protein [Usitatibacter sp.]|nr:MotA/TolQ/ExbB proton channel family protein [Usitatibacter sp.]